MYRPPLGTRTGKGGRAAKWSRSYAGGTKFESPLDIAQNTFKRSVLKYHGGGSVVGGIGTMEQSRFMNMKVLAAVRVFMYVNDVKTLADIQSYLFTESDDITTNIGTFISYFLPVVGQDDDERKKQNYALQYVRFLHEFLRYMYLSLENTGKLKYVDYEEEEESCDDLTECEYDEQEAY